MFSANVFLEIFSFYQEESYVNLKRHRDNVKLFFEIAENGIKEMFFLSYFFISELHDLYGNFSKKNFTTTKVT